MPDNINTCTAIANSATASLPELANIIRTEHAVVAQGANKVLAHALVLGRALIAAQEQLSTKPKGEWEAWLLANCRFGERHARRYTALVRAYDARGHSVSANLVDLSLRGLMQRLSPPKSHDQPQPAALTQPKHREPTKSFAAKTGYTDIIEAWLGASTEQRTRALDGIGLTPLLAAMPPEWWPLIEQHLAERQKPSMPTVTATAAIVADLSIPSFLLRTRESGGDVMEQSLGILSIDPGPPGALAGMLLNAVHACVCGGRTVVVGNGCDFYQSNRSVHHKKGGHHGQA
jgi:hypothetical protein